MNNDIIMIDGVHDNEPRRSETRERRWQEG